MGGCLSGPAPPLLPACSRPLAVEVVLEDDLRDACKPGDRVAVCGVYKPVAPRANGSVSGVFKAVVVANAVAKLSRDACSPVFSEEDYDNITVGG